MFEVSVILPVYNAEKFIHNCLHSIFVQSYPLSFELSVYNDGSSDKSVEILQDWTKKLQARNIVVLVSHGSAPPKGVGYAKNRAIESSSGDYLCFLDSDDEMHEYRIEDQLKACKLLPNNTVVGCQFNREPFNSTPRYAAWANNLNENQLYTQRYTSHGPTVIMPTWFCHRSVIENVGGFDESGKGTPEDLLFFNKHLDNGGKLYKVEKELLMYRYHENATSFSVKEETIWNVRVASLQKNVLTKWGSFSIWNAGKQGRKLYRSLSEENRVKVVSFCDVDTKKIKKGFYTFEETKERPKPRIPIVHYSQVEKPLIVCLKLDLVAQTGFVQETLDSLDFVEGIDYFHFN